MLKTRIKNIISSIIIMTSGIGIPVYYQTYKEENKKN